MNKIYLITYNTDGYFNRMGFHKHIESLFKNGVIKNWWHYIDNVYLVISDSSINEIHNGIYHAVLHRNLFIVEINPNHAQGWLPKEAWEWLSRYSK